MTAVRRSEAALTYLDTMFELYEVDGLLWFTSDQLSDVLKVDCAVKYRDKAPMFTGWLARRQPLPVTTDGQRAGSEPTVRLKLLFSVKGALFLASLCNGHQAKAFAQWLMQLQGPPAPPGAMPVTSRSD